MLGDRRTGRPRARTVTGQQAMWNEEEKHADGGEGGEHGRRAALVVEGDA